MACWTPALRWGGGKRSTALQKPAAATFNTPADTARYAKRYKSAFKAAPSATGNQATPVDTPLIPDAELPIQAATQQDAVTAEPAPIQGSTLKDTSGQDTQITIQPAQGMHNCRDDGHVMHDAMAEDGSEQMQGAQDTQADTQTHSSKHLATNTHGLHGGDAPMQTPLIDPLEMVQSIKKGYHVDPLFASSVAAEANRIKLGIHAQSDMYRKGVAVCVPDAHGLRHGITKEVHCSPYAGHTGMNRTLVLVSTSIGLTCNKT